MPVTEWKKTATLATCTGNAADFTDTDPLETGKTGLLKAECSNDGFCGNFAGGSGSNALAEVGKFEWGDSGKAMISEPALSSRLLADVGSLVREFGYWDAFSLFDPRAHFWAFLDLGIQTIGGLWFELEILLFQVAAFPLPKGLAVNLPNVTGGSSRISIYPYIWPGEGFGTWQDFTRIPLGSIASERAVSWGFQPTDCKIKGAMFGVESTSMKGKASFDKCRIYFNDEVTGETTGGLGGGIVPASYFFYQPETRTGLGGTRGGGLVGPE